jgi:hypothetical protein
MSITTVCTGCGLRQPIEAGLVEDDAKRLAAVLADMEPALARAALAYLRLFKPAKSELRIVRAAKILRDLQDLVATGTVCRDERSGERKAAPVAAWVAGIEKMLAAPPSDQIENHNYLRKVVWNVADDIAAVPASNGTRVAHTGNSPPVGRIDTLSEKLAFLRQQLEYDQITQEEYDRQARIARENHR